VGAIFTGVRVIYGDDNVLEKHKNRAAGLSPAEFVLGWFNLEKSVETGLNC
jgi:hypothetical protein